MNLAPVQNVSLASLASDASAPGGTPAPAKAVDIASFQSAMASANAAPANVAQAGGVTSTSQVAPAIKAVLSPLMALNGRASTLGMEASRLGSISENLKPGEMVKLTFGCYQFMFQSEVTSNVANRTSDGVQQLFREQS